MLLCVCVACLLGTGCHTCLLQYESPCSILDERGCYCMLSRSTGHGAFRVRAAGAQVLSLCPQGPQMMFMACFALTLMILTLALPQSGGCKAESDIFIGCCSFIALIYSPGWASGTLWSMVRTWFWLLMWSFLLCHWVVAGWISRVYRQQWGLCA